MDAAEFDALRQAAEDITRAWPPRKAGLALRAAGITPRVAGRESLDAIAADAGVSRETVRRARNELLTALENRSTDEVTVPSLVRRTHSEEGRFEDHATARALRRLLTMTGPLAWDEVLSAWARAGGRYPYGPLPGDL